MDDDFELFDIESVFDNGDKEIMKRLSWYISKTSLQINSSFEAFHKKINASRQLHVRNTEIIRYLHDDYKRLEHEVEEKLLAQKLINKKLQYAEEMKVRENLEKDMKKEKEKKQNLMLAVDELQEALETKKEEMKKKWNAIVKAKAVFKNILNIYINFDEVDNYHLVKVVHFLDRNPNKDNYYVIFCNFQNSNWKVDSTKPTLKDEHLTLLKLDFSEYYNIRDIVRFVYEIRTIFAKYYLT